MIKKEEDMNKKENFETSQIHVVVWLQMNGFPIKEIIWSSDDRAVFVFKNFKGREKLIQDFFKEEKLQKYISVSQETRARMYACKPSNRRRI